MESRSVAWCSLETPLGRLFTAETRYGLLGVGLPGEEPAGFVRSLTDLYPGAEPVERPEAELPSALQLAEYARQERQEFELPIHWTGTDFQRRVWAHLARVAFGATVTYGWLARAVEAPRAARAVGAAMAANPVPIVVPCHRVLASGGALGGFSGGLEMKRRLLVHEGALLAL